MSTHTHAPNMQIEKHGTRKTCNDQGSHPHLMSIRAHYLYTHAVSSTLTLKFAIEHTNTKDGHARKCMVPSHADQVYPTRPTSFQIKSAISMGSSSICVW